jgi:hypothetical protein
MGLERGLGRRLTEGGWRIEEGGAVMSAFLACFYTVISSRYHRVVIGFLYFTALSRPSMLVYAGSQK